MPNNRLDSVFAKKKSLRSVFFTAGYPFLDSTIPLLKLLEEEGVDFVEIGFPFSDPVADGSVIQHSNQVSLSNGMTLEVLFNQLQEIRKQISLPLILMGYLNPVEQYGYEKFVSDCKKVGVDGLILPDLPLDLLQSRYRAIFHEANLHAILLATPTSSDERLRQLDQLSTSFLYAVSSAAVTGGAAVMDQSRINYFERLKNLNLKSPLSVGFGIDGKAALDKVHQYCQAAIIGSAFLKAIGQDLNYLERGRAFLRSL